MTKIELDKTRLEDLVRRGKTFGQIARILGCSRSVIQRNARELGLKSKYSIAVAQPTVYNNLTITNEDMKAWETFVEPMALSWSRRMNRDVLSKKDTRQVVNIQGWTVEDVKQELRIAVWDALRTHIVDPTLPPLYPYVIYCLRNCLSNLTARTWRQKSGNKVDHNFETDNMFNGDNTYQEDLKALKGKYVK